MHESISYEASGAFYENLETILTKVALIISECLGTATRLYSSQCF